MPASWSPLDMCIHFSLSYSPCDSFFESTHHRDHMTETFLSWVSLHFLMTFSGFRPAVSTTFTFSSIITSGAIISGFMSLLPCFTLYASTMPSKSGGTPTGNNLQEDFHCLPKSLSSSGMSLVLNLCFLLNLWPLRDIHTKGPWASFNTWFCSRNDPGNTCFCQTSIESKALRNCCIYIIYSFLLATVQMLWDASLSVNWRHFLNWQGTVQKRSNKSIRRGKDCKMCECICHVLPSQKLEAIHPPRFCSCFLLRYANQTLAGTQAS